MIILTISFLLLLLIYFSIEYTFLRTTLKKIPLRILVNGTRGKSTTTKIIYEILRQEKYKVFAKTTGEIPIQYLPNGTNKQIARFSPASIIENIRLLREWAYESPDSIVMECMALQPETQRNLSTHIFKPNYILISNIHLDHAEAMGNKFEEMVSTIFECINNRANILITNQVAEKLKQFGKSLENVRIAEREEFPGKFDHIPSQIVDQNWSLIKTFAKQLNIDIQIAYQCFHEIHSSMNKKIYIEVPDSNWTFWNLFSVNDHESAAMFIRHSRQNQLSETQKIILFNTRSDRPLRTKYFAGLVLQEFPKNISIWTTGSGKRFARNVFRRKNMGYNSIILMSPKEVLDKLISGFDLPAIIYGIGNFYGMQEIIEHLFALESQNV